MAQRRMPGASLMQSDIGSLQFAANSFDAIVALYSIIHVPREEHASLFARMHEWLRPGGREPGLN